MLPAITPPTDNLYKFICLFGLTLFLFFSYNLSIVHGRSANCHMKVENVKIKVQRSLVKLKRAHKIDFEAAPTPFWKQTFETTRVKIELERIQQKLKKAHLDDYTFFGLTSELNKIEIENHALQIKIRLYISFLSLGAIMIFWGFFRWKRKDQNLRDEILVLEREIKLLERDNLKTKNKV